MKAVIHESYGQPEVLKIMEVEKPQVPDDGVLVRVHASSVNIAEWYGMTGLLIGRLIGNGLFKPKDIRLGADFSGVVEAVGKDVADFKPGDEVFGGRSGAFAEYVTVKKAIVHKPANITFEEAASVPTAGITALQGLRDHGRIQPGQKVLINGASGGVGTFAVQIAKSFGAEVTAVCSTRNLEMAHAIGADHVMDYTKENFSKNRQRYDLIFAVNGSHPIQDYWRALSPGGVYVCAGGSIAQILQAILVGPLLSRIGRKKLGFMGIAKTNHQDLLALKVLLEGGQVRPVIDKSYPLDEVAGAVRYLVEEHARGKVVIAVAQNGEARQSSD